MCDLCLLANYTGAGMPLPEPGDTRIEAEIGGFVDSPPAVVSSFDWGEEPGLAGGSGKPWRRRRQA